MARNGTGINTVADLRGKRVATAFASTAHYSLLAALAQAGVNPADVDIIDLQPQASLAAWQRGDVDAVYTWRKVQARALALIHDDPQAAAKAVAAQLGTTPEDAANQLKQGTFLTAAELTSPTWLGVDGQPGNLAENLHSAAEFLAGQQQIPSAPPLSTFQQAIYTKGLPGVLSSQ